MMRKFTLPVCWLLNLLLIYFQPRVLFAQDPIIHLTFSAGDDGSYPAVVDPTEAVYAVDLLRPKFVKGVSDLALDLSADAMLRRPWVLDKFRYESIDFTQSFSVQLFVKTKPGAKLGTSIAGNKVHDSLALAGWQILGQPNGAWGINLSDGIHQLNYLPTDRTRINDGYWHQIVFSIEKPKNEARMYFDGQQVAIYNLLDLGALTGEKRTVIGGSDQYFEWGSAGQWKAFNGYLDEVKIWNRSISEKEVKDAWHVFFPERPSSVQKPPSNQIKVMTWNIWHGGRRYGEQVGVARTIETIKASQADIICMIETYGSGALIADALGYSFYLISSNLSILSKYPLKETIEAFRPFNFGGAIVELAPGQELLVFDTWLHYLPDYLEAVGKKRGTAEDLIEAEKETRAKEIDQILNEIRSQLTRPGLQGVLMAGDFNSGSHLDWTEQTKDIHHQYVVDWPVSMSMARAGFQDSYRILHIDPLTNPDTLGHREPPLHQTGMAHGIESIIFISRAL